MGQLTCQKCNAIDDYYTEVKANNNVARCNQCDSFIKNISYDKPKLYMGKYKGIPIDEIEDLSYLKWAAANMVTIGKKIRDAIHSQISKLEYISK